MRLMSATAVNLLRKELGMAAYAILNRPRIDTALEKSNVVADGLYSWEEYLDFKNYLWRTLLCSSRMQFPPDQICPIGCSPGTTLDGGRISQPGQVRDRKPE